MSGKPRIAERLTSPGNVAFTVPPAGTQLDGEHRSNGALPAASTTRRARRVLWNGRFISYGVEAQQPLAFDFVCTEHDQPPIR